MESLLLIGLGCICASVVGKIGKVIKNRKERKEKEHDSYLDQKVKELFAQWEENARQALQPRAAALA